MEVRYSDKPEWKPLTIPHYHGPFALHFLVLGCAVLVWVAEMVFHPRKNSRVLGVCDLTQNYNHIIILDFHSGDPKPTINSGGAQDVFWHSRKVKKCCWVRGG